MFADPFFTRLGVRHVRYVVAWDALRKAPDRAEVDRWMAAAKAARVRVLLAFNVSRDLTGAASCSRPPATGACSCPSAPAIRS